MILYTMIATSLDTHASNSTAVRMDYFALIGGHMIQGVSVRGEPPFPNNGGAAFLKPGGLQDPPP